MKIDERNAQIEVIEKTSSGARILLLKGIITEIKDEWVKINGYLVNCNNIVKFNYI